MLPISELKSSTRKELLKELEQARKTLQEWRLGVKTSHLKDSSLISKQQRYIAQMLTLLKEMDLDEKVQHAQKLSVS